MKDSKVWQEFHLNDSGKKRSFVLHFEKGQEFDEFFIKFSEVLSWLHACKKGKLSVDKSKNNAIKINHLFHIHLS